MIFQSKLEIRQCAKTEFSDKSLLIRGGLRLVAGISRNLRMVVFDNGNLLDLSRVHSLGVLNGLALRTCLRYESSVPRDVESRLSGSHLEFLVEFSFFQCAIRVQFIIWFRTQLSHLELVLAWSHLVFHCVGWLVIGPLWSPSLRGLVWVCNHGLIVGFPVLGSGIQAGLHIAGIELAQRI